MYNIITHHCLTKRLNPPKIVKINTYELNIVESKAQIAPIELYQRIVNCPKEK